MRPIENKRSVYMTIAEIKEKVERFKGNRCCYLDKEQSKSLGYTKFDFERSNFRINYYDKNIFKKNGYKWHMATPMVIYVIANQDNKWVIADGNGRWTNFLKEGIDPNTEIPVDIITCEDASEVTEGIVAMNQYHKAYTSSDMMRMKAIECGGEIEQIFNEIKDLQERLNTKNEFVIRQMYLGDKKRRRDSLPTSHSELKPNGDIELAFMEKIYKYFEGRTSDKRDKLVNEVKSYKNGEFFDRFFNHMSLVLDHDRSLLEKELDKFVDKFIEIIDDEDDTIILRMLKSNNRNMDESGLFKFIKKIFKTKTIKLTLDHMIARKR